MKNKTDQEIVKLLTDTRTELRTERFSAAGARAKDSNSPKKLRTKIARMLTEQHARVLASHISRRGTLDGKRSSEGKP